MLAGANVQICVIIALLACGTASPSVNEPTNSTPQAGAVRQRPGAGYIVLLRHDPLPALISGLPGFAATGPENSRKVDFRSTSVQAYAAFLDSQSKAVAARAGVEDLVQYHYKHAIAGFSTGLLSEEQIKRLQQDPAISEIRRQRLNSIKTHSTSKFLGPQESSNINNSHNSRQLINSHSSRDSLGHTVARSQAAANSHAGEGVVIGIIDTGIWPEAPSFSDMLDPPLSQKALGAFVGECNTAADYPQRFCNAKVVGCSWFNKGWGGDEQTKMLFPEAHLSCRDDSGHGTHVAGIAAGNSGVQTPQGLISGTAPRASIAVYKAFWGPQAANTDADTIAAIDQAAADGVDIINYSAGPSFPAQTFRDPVSLAFMGAARAGVFIAMSAGNEGGDKPSSLTGIDPWAIVVAASTLGAASARCEGLELGDQGITEGLGAKGGLGLEDGSTSSLGNWSQGSEVSELLLQTVTVDGAQKEGNHSQLGKCPRMSKLGPTQAGEEFVVSSSADVISRILSATEVLSTNHPGSTPCRTLAATANTTEAPTVISPGRFKSAHEVTRVAGFSSRGPVPAGKGALLKPDVAAPGVNVYAATSPDVEPHQQYIHMSGTSMATPHIAGLAALLRQLYPAWSPMAIKSALMTSAYQISSAEKGSGDVASPLAVGAGHVDPGKMFNAGLVFNSQYQDWRNFLCGAEQGTQDEFCAQCLDDAKLCDPKHFNMPSIALPEVLTTKATTVHRTVTSVLSSSATFWYNATLDVGGSQFVRVSVIPHSFTLGPGESQQLEIQVQVLPTAPHKKCLSGSVTWTSSEGTVTRIPIVVRSVAVSAAEEIIIKKNLVNFSQPLDPVLSYDISSGFTGVMHASAHGFIREVVRQGVLRSEYGTFEIVIPTNIALARFQLLQAEYPSDIDLDFEVSLENRIISTSWTRESSDETIDLHNPKPGVYKFGVHLHSFAVPSNSIPFKLHAFLVPRVGVEGSNAISASSLQLERDTFYVHSGDTSVIRFTFDDSLLQSAVRYLGLIEYNTPGDNDALTRTLISLT